MKALLYTFVCLALAVNVKGQTADEKEVTAVFTEFNNALLNSDKNRLLALISNSLSYGHSTGRIESKQEFIEALASGKSDFLSLSTSNQTFKITGNTAIVRHKLVANVIDNGTSLNLNLGVMLIWQKSQGKWKLLARQAYKL